MSKVWSAAEDLMEDANVPAIVVVMKRRRFHEELSIVVILRAW
jgi:hypothetical protein